jgi:hypothetical protein
MRIVIQAIAKIGRRHPVRYQPHPISPPVSGAMAPPEVEGAPVSRSTGSRAALFAIPFSFTPPVPRIDLWTLIMDPSVLLFISHTTFYRRAQVTNPASSRVSSLAARFSSHTVEAFSTTGSAAACPETEHSI